MKISTENIKSYDWGDKCKGWQLVNTKDLSIIQESMPCGTSEGLHHHEHSNQFFYILAGSATFEVDGKEIIVNEREGIEIKKGTVHRVSNQAQENLEFLLISQPHAHGDRINK